MAPPPRLLAYFGHHKCASTWVHNIVGTLCDDAGWRCAYLANEGMFDGDLAGWLRANPTEFLCYVNADMDQLEALRGQYRGFHMVRDPRDILASAYFSHKHSHKTGAWPALVEHRKRLHELDQHEGLMLEMDFNADVFAEMARWDGNQEDVLELKMEEFTTDPLNQWLKVFRHLGIGDEGHYGKKQAWSFLVRSCMNVAHRHAKLPTRNQLATLPMERCLGVVHDHRFETKTGGRGEGTEDVKSHYRKGVAGDWVNHFSAEHVAEFKRRYGDLLVKLGYEDDDAWGLPEGVAA
jgi:hypothetical protein